MSNFWRLLWKCSKSYKMCQSMQVKWGHTKTHENFKIGASFWNTGWLIIDVSKRNVDEFG